MELIAGHASHLPHLDDLIIKRVNEFCCLNWHLAIRTGHNNDCFEHAIALKHNKCLFKLLKYYASSQYQPCIIRLSYICGYYDNLEALKYMYANYSIKFNTFYNLIDYAISGSSFKCLIFYVEQKSHVLRGEGFFYAFSYMNTTSDFDVGTNLHFHYLDAVVFRNKNYIRNINTYMYCNGYGKIRF